MDYNPLVLGTQPSVAEENHACFFEATLVHAQTWNIKIPSPNLPLLKESKETLQTAVKISMSHFWHNLFCYFYLFNPGFLLPTSHFLGSIAIFTYIF